MKFKVLSTVIISAMSIMAVASDDDKSKSTRAGSVPGYVAHGINTYNGMPIGDYSKVAPKVGMFHANPAIEEIGFYQKDAMDAGTITENTDRRTKVATTRSFLNAMNPTGHVDPSWINVPLAQIGTTFFGSSSITDRVVPVDYPKTAIDPVIFREKGVVSSPTVGDWEKISGKLSYVNNNDGTSTVKVTVNDAFPNAVYTLWDVGVNNPLTEMEMAYAIPFGGLPNIVLTNAKGCGYKEINLPYQLTRECKQGAASCTSYISAFYHWDTQVFGGSPAATWYGAPVGVIAGNQMVWPTTGDVLVNPATKFKSKKHGCN
jgi:hypothetical protein